MIYRSTSYINYKIIIDIIIMALMNNEADSCVCAGNNVMFM